MAKLVKWLAATAIALCLITWTFRERIADARLLWMGIGLIPALMLILLILSRRIEIASIRGRR
jgi:hypothetical protein